LKNPHPLKSGFAPQRERERGEGEKGRKGEREGDEALMRLTGCQ